MSLTKASYSLINGTPLNVVDYGAVADGVTDNTSVITALFTSLGASYSGVIYIPYGVKYDFNTVAPLAPVRATITDESLINAWDTPGFRQKVIGVWESGDPTAIADTNYTISSGHNPTFVLENRGTAGSSSANSRVAPILWSSGRFQTGEPGIRAMAKLQFGVSQYRSDLWALAMRKLTTWDARDYEIWATGKSFTTGDYTITSGRTYVAASTGVAGATQPTWTSGTASDGGVDWTFVETTQDSFIFGVDEYGRINTNGTSVGYTYRFRQNIMDSENLVAAFEARGDSKTVNLRLNGTDVSGNQNSGPFLRATTDGVLELRNGSGTLRLFDADTDSFNVGPMGRIEINAVDGDTSPSVSQAGALIIQNTGATSITTLDDMAGNQEVMLIFNDDLTTLVQSANFRLKGAVNVTPTQGAGEPFPVIIMKKQTGSNIIFEISRNF